MLILNCGCLLCYLKNISMEYIMLSHFWQTFVSKCWIWYFE
jgi:hypothetical protein